MAQPLPPPTDVCLTVDVECSIAGTFDDPRRFHPVAEAVVECAVEGKGQGLDFLLRTLAEHQQSATFFVETLCAHYFGDEPMRGYARRIAEAGHEVALHVHPCWTAFAHPDWRTRLERPNHADMISDDLRGRPLAESVGLIDTARRRLMTWTGTSPTAIRMGNLMGDLPLYRVFQALGFTTSSNVGLAIQPVSDGALTLSGGCRRIEDVAELPVLTYQAMLPLGATRARCLTITGTGAATTRGLLMAARAAGMSSVVILTHPFEFAKTRDFTYGALRPNRINQARLRDLCAFVAAHPKAFRMSTLTEAATRAGDDAPAPCLDAPLWSIVPDLAANRLNDMVWSL